MKNYFGTLNSANDHLLRDAILANNYGVDKFKNEQDVWCVSCFMYAIMQN